MKLSRFVLLVLLFPPSVLQAQMPLITPTMPVDTATLHLWLNSNDPRLVAWAGDFARRNHDKQILAEIVDFLRKQEIPKEDTQNKSEIERRLAASSLLDALIEEKVDVPMDMVEAIATPFPTQAAVLVSRMPLYRSHKTLEKWVDEENMPLLRRLSAMLLAKDPKSSHGYWNHQQVGFVASIVGGMKPRLLITVTDGSPQGSYLACGIISGSERRNLNNWPTLYTYVISEYPEEEKPPITLVQLGESALYAARLQGESSDYRNGFDQLNPATRHKLIAYWLGVKDREMPWQTTEGATIDWKNLASYEEEKNRLAALQNAKIRATIEQLHKRGLMTEEETRKIAPTLTLEIECDIDPCPIPQLTTHHYPGCTIFPKRG